MTFEDILVLGTKYTSTHPVATSAKPVLSEACVGLEQVGLDALGRLHCHLGGVLQDEDGEFLAGHRGQPQAEVSVHLVRVDLLHQPLHGRHKAGGQVTVLEEHPLAPLHG